MTSRYRLSSSAIERLRVMKGAAIDVQDRCDGIWRGAKTRFGNEMVRYRQRREQRAVDYRSVSVFMPIGSAGINISERS